MRLEKIQIVPFEIADVYLIDSLISLDTLYLNEFSTAWNESNFQLDLPDKKYLSKLVFIDNTLIGYLICSSYNVPKICHIHRFVLHPDYRGSGIASRMMHQLASECTDINISEITFEISNNNTRTRHFYKKLGARALEGDELNCYLRSKNKEKQRSNFNNETNGIGIYCLTATNLLEEYNK